MIGWILIALVGWIAALIIGYHWYQGRLRIDEQAETEATLRADLLEARGDVDDLMAGHASDVMRLERLLHEAEADVELAQGLRADDIAFLRGQLAAAQLDADMHATALRGLLEHEARADLVDPDEPRGYAQTFALGQPTANVTPIKKAVRR